MSPRCGPYPTGEEVAVALPRNEAYLESVRNRNSLAEGRYLEEELLTGPYHQGHGLVPTVPLKVLIRTLQWLSELACLEGFQNEVAPIGSGCQSQSSGLIRLQDEPIPVIP